MIYQPLRLSVDNTNPGHSFASFVHLTRPILNDLKSANHYHILDWFGRQGPSKPHPFRLALVSRPILLTIHNEERSLTPLVVISRQNPLVKEQEGGYDEHAWQHITDPCGYHPPVFSYI